MISVSEHIRHNARRCPEKTALIEAGARRTYRELDAAANRVTNALQATGIRRGDKVALLCHSCIEWIEIYLGIARSGAVAVPCNYRETAEEIGFTIEDSESRAVFLSHAYRGPVGAGLDDVPIVVVDGHASDSVAAFTQHRSTADPRTPVRPDGLAVILYTGGTTGRSKGVVLSHENLFWNSINMIVDTQMRESDNTILTTPLHHSASLNCWLLPHLYLGATATLLRSYSPEAMLRAIAEQRVTNGFTPPSMARDLFLHPLARELDIACFERWYIGGVILSRRDQEHIHELLPDCRIYYQYGLTEAGPIVSVLKEADYEAAPESVGRAFLNIETKILRQDLSDAEPGEIGELVVRGPSIMTEYHKRPDATAAAFHDGWLRTGDLCRMDKNGYIFFHDRLKDMIKSGGLNVYSQEVESVLSRHFAVREVAVIGLNSEAWGEAVTAVIVPHAGVEVSETDIIDFAKRSLAGYKAPKKVIFVPYEDMPINQSGKILKRELRGRLST